MDDGQVNTFSQPSYGTSVLPDDPAGHASRVPMIVGTNRSEMRLYVAFAMAAGVSYDDAFVRSLFDDTYGAGAADVRARYTDGDAASRWAQAVTDQGWACPTLADADTYRGPVYAYSFADPNPPPLPGYPQLPDFPLGPAHGSELASLFWDAPGTAAQQDLSRTMIGYWTRFARTGDPNGSGLPRWPRFDGTTAQWLAPDRVGPVDAAAAHRCRFWAGR